ncbi:MAG: glycoside hydrolase [Kiritimatiellae bacterium]|nr:glycoside hydrolase [Kiritimatiellia bacterium]
MRISAIAASAAATVSLAAQAALTVIEPLEGEKWWGGILNDGESMPYVDTDRPRDVGVKGRGGATAPFLVSSAGRYVWSDRPFVFAATNGTIYITSPLGAVEPVEAGSTLREAYLAACAKHFPFDGRLPAELLFTKPQWNNWIEIAIQGMKQSSVDAYTDALAKSGFPCGVYMMDGGWLSHQGSFKFYADDFPDPKGMFKRIRDNGWKSMIWTAYFVSPDSREYKMLRHGKGYMIEGKDVLAYDKFKPKSKRAGVIWWWSGISSVYDLTYAPGRDCFVKTLKDFAAEYGIDGFKFDAGDAEPLAESLRFHDPKKEAPDYVHEYAKLIADNFEYNEARCGFCSGGIPVMQRLIDQHHSWKSLQSISGRMQAAGLLGSPYVVADMVGGGEANTFRPGGFFSEKLFVRSAALQALHPMMQFSAAPWRYLSAEGVAACRLFADLHVEFGPYILELARHASKTGEPILRSMEYEFPHQGFDRLMNQFMLGGDWLVAPVVTEDDSTTVELPAGRWLDDLGATHEGPKKMKLEKVPLTRLPRYRRL